MSNLFDSYARAFEARRETVMSIQEYLEGCRNRPDDVCRAA